MSVVHAATAGPALPEPACATRTVRVGLLGLGRVGQAVARAIQSSSAALRARGLAVRVEAALVRDPQRPRRCPRVARVTNNPEAFLRGRYDVVIEALGGVEPARTIVARLLGRGVPVVSANKAVIAAHGAALHAIARRGGSQLRYEAAALAGVPFLGAFSRRPLVASVTEITAIVNGTTNYVLTLLARGEAQTIDDALRRAQALGYAEPDASADVSGRDAADKLLVLLRDCAGVSATRGGLEVSGIECVTRAHLDAARAHGGTLKPVVRAEIGDEVRAWVAPAFVPREHPLAAVDGALNGICLSGRFVPDLFFSGPGAGPDVTAATLVDDLVEIACDTPSPARSRDPQPALRPVRPAPSAWFDAGGCAYRVVGR
jgi:homoserine dehydrogenase